MRGNLSCIKSPRLRTKGQFLQVEQFAQKRIKEYACKLLCLLIAYGVQGVLKDDLKKKKDNTMTHTDITCVKDFIKLIQ